MHRPSAAHIQATENITGIATHLDGCPSNCCRVPNQDPSFQRRGHNAKETVDHDRQSSKVQKFSPTGKRNANNCSYRSTRGPGRGKNGSFPAVRAQFSALSVEDRLQFLSWLFEGALSHCVSTCANADAASMSRSIPSQDVDISYDYPSSNTELVDTQSTPTRKGLPWSAEEIYLLVKLREEQNLAWSEVTKLFAQKFPGRSKGSIQVYWSTTLTICLARILNYTDRNTTPR